MLGGGDEKILAKVLTDLTDKLKTTYVTPKCWRTIEVKNWSKLRPQGFGVNLYKNDKTSNSWLKPYGCTKWEESNFIRAIQMRSNTLPTLELYARGGGNPNPPRCRACIIGPETASHILGVCAETKANRMQRHNKLCSLLAKAGKKKKWEVYKEKHVKMRN